MVFSLKYVSLSWLICLVLMSGCTSDDIPTPGANEGDRPVGSDYYPLTVNQYAVYHVEDIRYSLRDGADTGQYQLLERVADSLPGAGGEIIYTLERYTRNLPDDAWALDSIWTARKSERRVVVVENNVPFVKLVFPLQAGTEWDGNALNSRPPQTYTLTLTDSTLQREIGLDSLLVQSRTVVQRQLETLVNDSVLVETYGPGVGLIYKKSRVVEYCADEDCIGQKQIEAGRIYRQTLIEHGKK